MYIIAEIGVNHENNIEKAKQMIKDAAENGANAIKFQFYKAKNLAVNKENTSYWNTNEESTTSQFELFKKYDKFGIEEYKILQEECKKNHVEFILTCFDFNTVRLASDYLNLKTYKIASADITHLLLIEEISKYADTIILSVGGANKREIDKALETIKSINLNINVILMHCILRYPCEDENLNLNRIKTLCKTYPSIEIGYSDHSKFNVQTLLNANLLGAEYIEKHFTYDKTLPGNDHYHAMNKNDLNLLMKSYYKMEKTLGVKCLDWLVCEDNARKYARRSIVVDRDLKKGSILKFYNIDFKRPCFGVPANEFSKVINKKINKDMKKDDILKYEDLEV